MPEPELLSNLRRLPLIARQRGGGLLARPAVNVLAGGTEVTGYRDYSPGDDYRAIDWRICARHDELIVRQYQGETQRHTYILLDCSQSMTLGKPTKFEAAQKAAAALAYVALANQDRVGLLAFSQRIVANNGPLAGKSRTAHALRFLDGMAPREGQTSLAQSAAEFVRRNQRPGLAVVVSDFLDPAGFEPGLNLLRRAGYPPRIVQIYNSSESDPELLGDVELFDVETHTSRQVTITERHLAKYHQLLEQHTDALRTYCVKYRLGYVRLSNTLPEAELLLRAIGARGAREP